MSELLQKHYPKEILKPRSSSEGVPSISVAVSEEGGVGWRAGHCLPVHTVADVLCFSFYECLMIVPIFVWH